MKRIFLFSALLFPFILKAQDYQNICSPGISFFVKADSSLRAFRQDSIHLPGNNDTIFFSYPTIGLFTDSLGCLDTAKGSVLGRKVIKKHDGWFYFFNKDNDTVWINSQAALNSYWKFSPLPGNAYLQAQVTAIITENILGISDQVKVITLQAKDQNSVNISHPFNQKVIKLSKHYGFTKMYDVNFIPDDTTAFSIAGKNTPLTGLQNISWKDAFTFEAGDISHFRRTFSTYNSGGTENSINRVLQRIIYGSWDSVSYQIETCSAMDYGPPATHSTSFDTSWVTYNLSTLAANPEIAYLPDEFAPQGVYCSAHSGFKGFGNRAVKGYTPGTFGGDPVKRCWERLVDGGWLDCGYAKGLGQVYSHFIGWDGSLNNKNMVYFRKGSETWGTQVATSCSSLVAVDDRPAANPLKLVISPDPVTDKAEVHVEGLRPDVPVRFTLTDFTGREISRSEVFTGSLVFSRGSLPSGLYILFLTNTGGTVHLSSRLILK